MNYQKGCSKNRVVCCVPKNCHKVEDKKCECAPKPKCCPRTLLVKGKEEIGQNVVAGKEVNGQLSSVELSNWVRKDCKFIGFTFTLSNADAECFKVKTCRDVFESTEEDLQNQKWVHPGSECGYCFNEILEVEFCYTFTNGMSMSNP